MQDDATPIGIDLLNTEMDIFAAHFETDFCHIDTFKPYMPEINWVLQTSTAPGQVFDYAYVMGHLEYEEYLRDAGINFEKQDSRWMGQGARTLPDTILMSWRVNGYAVLHDNPVSGIRCSLTVSRYHADRLRIVLEKTKPFFPVPETIDNFDLFTRIFLAWLAPRWGKEGAGYIRLEPGHTPKHTASYLPECDLWLDILLRNEIEKGSDAWWAQIERWTREHWQRHGRQSLPISPKLEEITGYSRSQIYAKTMLGGKSGQ